MDTSSSCQGELVLGFKGASVCLLVVLIGYILADVAVVSILNRLQNSGGFVSLGSRAEGEITAMNMAVLSMINPGLITGLSIAVLKMRFPGAKVVSVLRYFGFGLLPSKQAMLLSFVGGMAFLFFFTEILQQIFPPDDFAAQHPANDINYGSTMTKAAFALSIVCLVPIAEEFLFRGVIYKGIAQSSNKAFSGLLVSVLFVLLHTESISTGYWLTHVALYSFPILLVVLREITGTLYAPILLHSGFNFAEVFF